MVYLSTQVLRALRPVHWVKNFALFAALVFSGNLFNEEMFLRVVLAFFSFSLAASATYIFNDILDIKSDKIHPIKKKRPIASGKIPIITSYFLAIILALISLYWSSFFGITFLV